jgi:hypothetical protein
MFQAVLLSSNVFAIYIDIILFPHSEKIIAKVTAFLLVLQHMKFCCCAYDHAGRKCILM